MKNFSNFATTSPKSYKFYVVAIIMAALAHVCVANNNYQFLSDCYDYKTSNGLWRVKETDSFLYFNYCNFSFMPKSNENYNNANNSTIACTSFHETEIKLKQAISLPEISNILINLCEQIGNKIELHVHFNIQTVGDMVNSVVVGCNANDSNISIVEGSYNATTTYGHATVGDYSGIDGDITL